MVILMPTSNDVSEQVVCRLRPMHVGAIAAVPAHFSLALVESAAAVWAVAAIVGLPTLVAVKHRQEEVC